VRAGGAIDLDEIAMPEILDPRQVKGAAYSGPRSRNVLRALADLVNGYPDPTQRRKHAAGCASASATTEAPSVPFRSGLEPAHPQG
jgi:hypothetical protein